MTAAAVKTRIAWSLLLMVTMQVVSGCGMYSAYRPAVIKTIGDYSNASSYQKKVGIVALLNNTTFSGDQVPLPFMSAFLERIQSAATKAVLVVPGSAETPLFLWNPPRIANGEVDVFTISGLARQAGMNAVVSPVLMDIRVRQQDTGFWIFKDVAYSLQIQTAAAIYDAITGSRLALGILTDEVDIDEQDATNVRNGQEVMVDELVEVAQEMGEELGERMGDAINNSQWLAAVVAIQEAACVITAGSEAGIAVGDRFDVLDGSDVLTGLDGQRYIVPGEKISEIIINRVTERQSYGQPPSGELPPAGSIVIPNH
jgi:hypothetical protein